jgi:hypothetical protein
MYAIENEVFIYSTSLNYIYLSFTRIQINFSTNGSNSKKKRNKGKFRAEDFDNIISKHQQRRAVRQQK